MLSKHQFTAVLTGSVTLAISLLAAPPATAGDDALLIYSGGLERMMVDDKDQGLVKALRMINDRVSELPAELDNPMIPVPAIQLVYDLLSNQVLLRAGMIEDADPQAGPPFYAQINFMRDAEGAQALANRLAQMMQMVPMPSMPSDEAEGFSEIDLEGVPLYYGPWLEDGPPAVIVALNRLDTKMPNKPELGLPEGVRPAMALKFDAAAVGPLAEMLLMGAGPQAEMIREQLEMYGLMGPDAGTITAAMGHSDDRMHGIMRFGKYVQAATRQGTLVTEPLTLAHMKMIPADATIAEAGKAKFSAFLDMFTQQMGQMDPMGDEIDPIEMLAEETGFHLKKDLFEHLGETWGFYMSDSTGGGGLFSSVMFIELSNPDGLNASLDKLSETINALGAEHAKGYVQLRDTTVAGHALKMLTFPGLPIPLEISCGASGNYFFAGLTPHAIVAAMEQAKGNKPSILDNPRFMEMGGENWQGSMQFAFMDTPRMVRSGYGFTSLICAAISNAVRSPSDASRDAGLILPSFNDLLKGAKASTSFYRIDGNDMIVTTQADRSFLVNLAGGLGMLGNSGAPLVALVGASIMLPAISKARQNANEMREAAMDAFIRLLQPQAPALHSRAFFRSLQELLPEDTFKGYPSLEQLLPTKTRQKDADVTISLN